jgi:signal peptidase II
LKKYLRDYLQLFIVAVPIVFLDQWTKYLVRTNLAVQEVWSVAPWLTPYARIVHWQNTGAAFGMFQNFGVVFTVLAVVVSLVILYYYPRVPRDEWYLRLAMCLQLGGALGNLISRLTQGYIVTDFISLGNFAVFNISDASISMGVAVMLIGVWIKEREHKRDSHTPEVMSENNPMPDSKEPPVE